MPVLIVLVVSLFQVVPSLAVPSANTQELLARLEQYEQQARWWQYGWMGVHSVASLVQAAEAGRTSDKANKRANIVGSVSDALGFGDLLFRPLYPLSFSELTLSHLTPEEQKLKMLAERVEQRTSWLGHMEGWLTGVIGGLIIAGGHGKDSDALSFFLATGLVTEVEIWTLPKDALYDWRQYQQSGQVLPGSLKEKRVASWKPAGAGVMPHGMSLLWWF